MINFDEMKFIFLVLLNQFSIAEFKKFMLWLENSLMQEYKSKGFNCLAKYERDVSQTVYENVQSSCLERLKEISQQKEGGEVANEVRQESSSSHNFDISSMMSCHHPSASTLNIVQNCLTNQSLLTDLDDHSRSILEAINSNAAASTLLTLASSVSLSNKQQTSTTILDEHQNDENAEIIMLTDSVSNNESVVVTPRPDNANIVLKRVIDLPPKKWKNAREFLFINETSNSAFTPFKQQHDLPQPSQAHYPPASSSSSLSSSPFSPCSSYSPSPSSSSDVSFQFQANAAKTGSDPNKKRRGKAFTLRQKEELEKFFKYNKYISLKERGELAARLELTNVQIKDWFKNHRKLLKQKPVLNYKFLKAE
jgi:hypothetical protein